LTTSTYRLAQNDLNWLNLSQDQRDYFHHLAEGDPDRNGQEFFEDTVPPELQDRPQLVEKYLNGDPELGVSDKDWSHDVSRHNGGSDSADNGRFEDASTNRSRGADNTTEQEVFDADSASEEDVQTLLGSAEEVAKVTLAGSAVELAGSALEFGLDFLAPVAGGVWAAKRTADCFEGTPEKLAAGSLAGGATAALLCTPPGQLLVAGYVGYRGCKTLYRFASKHFAAS
jgi:hypothetical protein